MREEHNHKCTGVGIADCAWRRRGELPEIRDDQKGAKWGRARGREGGRPLNVCVVGISRG